MKRPIFLLLLWASLASTSKACTVCFGAPGSTETTAIGWSILFLVGVIGLVLGCIVAFAIHLAIRASRHPLPEEAAIAEALQAQTH